eukprot:Awhi_evm1s12587
MAEIDRFLFSVSSSDFGGNKRNHEFLNLAKDASAVFHNKRSKIETKLDLSPSFPSFARNHKAFQRRATESLGVESRNTNQEYNTLSDVRIECQKTKSDTLSTNKNELSNSSETRYSIKNLKQLLGESIKEAQTISETLRKILKGNDGKEDIERDCYLDDDDLLISIKTDMERNEKRSSDIQRVIDAEIGVGSGIIRGIDPKPKGNIGCVRIEDETNNELDCRIIANTMEVELKRKVENEFESWLALMDETQIKPDCLLKETNNRHRYDYDYSGASVENKTINSYDNQQFGHWTKDGKMSILSTSSPSTTTRAAKKKKLLLCPFEQCDKSFSVNSGLK